MASDEAGQADTNQSGAVTGLLVLAFGDQLALWLVQRPIHMGQSGAAFRTKGLALCRNQSTSKSCRGTVASAMQIHVDQPGLSDRTVAPALEDADHAPLLFPEVRHIKSGQVLGEKVISSQRRGSAVRGCADSGYEMSLLRT